MTNQQLLAALTSAEDENRDNRVFRATVADFIHNTPGHYKARAALAARLGLPAPARKDKPRARTHRPAA